MAIVKGFRPLPYSNDIYAEVGKIASDWAHFERELDRAIVCMSAGVAHERVLTCILSMVNGSGNKLRVILSLAKEWNVTEEKLIEKLTAFIGKDAEISSLRNRIVHDPLDLEWVSGSIFRHQRTISRSSGKLTDERLLVSSEDLIRIRERIAQHVRNFRMIYGRMCTLHPTLLGRPPLQPA